MQKGGFEFEPSFFYRLISKFILIQPLFCLKSKPWYNSKKLKVNNLTPIALSEISFNPFHKRLLSSQTYDATHKSMFKNSFYASKNN